MVDTAGPIEVGMVTVGTSVERGTPHDKSLRSDRSLKNYVLCPVLPETMGGKRPSGPIFQLLFYTNILKSIAIVDFVGDVGEGGGKVVLS